MHRHMFAVLLLFMVPAVAVAQTVVPDPVMLTKQLDVANQMLLEANNRIQQLGAMISIEKENLAKERATAKGLAEWWQAYAAGTANKK